MSVTTNDVFVEFECEHCHHKEKVSVADLIMSGHPICINCPNGELMEYDDRVYIPEYGD